MYGEEVLRRDTSEVKNIDEKIVKLIKSMKDTMRKRQGLGLAAPQSGVSKRIFIALGKNDKIITFINPETLSSSDKDDIDMEGCLSFPEIFFSIQRAKKIAIKAYNEKGKEFIIEADGLLARCFQHEMDHLNGKLIIDYATDEEKKYWQERLTKLTKSF